MRVLAVVPARAGSQRLPGKNWLDIKPGLSLVQHAIDCARGSGVVDTVAVSTDAADLLWHGALRVTRPPEISGPTADIAAAVQHTVFEIEAHHATYDYVVTLQPAVLARSPLIVRRLIEAVAQRRAFGGITAAHTVPWQWAVDGRAVRPSWGSGPYPRSQDCGTRLAEINAVQVTTGECARAGMRWQSPLVLAELPPWVAALDVDTPADLAQARDLWPWAGPRLETCEPIMHFGDVR